MTVSGKEKSRSRRRKNKISPSGKKTVKLIARKHSKPQCAGCGKLLHGVPRANSTEIRNMSKSAKRPSRPYGGVLCSSCSRVKIVDRFKNLFQ